MEAFLFWLKAVIGIASIAGFGAWASKRINQGAIPWYSSVAMAIPASLLWGRLS